MSDDDGATWSDPVKVDNAGGVGHQFFPDIDALGGTLAVVWQDSRTDACYDVQRPMGNAADAMKRRGFPVVPPHDDDGLAVAIRRYALRRAPSPSP